MSYYKTPVEFRLKSTFRAGKLIRSGDHYRIILIEFDKKVEPQTLFKQSDADWIKSDYKRIGDVPTAFFDLMLFTDPPVILPDLAELRRIANDRAGLIICESRETDLGSYDKYLANVGFKKECEVGGTPGRTYYYYILQQIGCCGLTY